MLVAADLLQYAEPDELDEIDRLLSAGDHAEYRTRPFDWMVQKLKIRPESLHWSVQPEYAAHKWDGTPEPLLAMLEGLAAGEDVGVEAGTGTQKSYTAACLILWFLACWEGARAFTFAPKEDQLRLFIWMEIGKLWPTFSEYFPSATLTDLCIRMRGGISEEWGAWGYAVGVVAGEQVSTKASGMHAEHLLLVYEETPGIPQAVIEAGENTCTAPHNIRLFLGNPNHQLDTLHIACTQPDVRHIIISALDHPNVVSGREVVPGAASRKAVQRRERKYGTTGPRYLTRVRGISPAESADSLIKLEWLQRSAARHAIRKLTADDLPAMGLDVAQSENGDQAVKVIGFGSYLKSLDSFQCNNATKLGTDAVEDARRIGISPSAIGVDSVGIGAATVNEMRQKLGGIQALNGGASPVDGAQKQADGEAQDWMPDVNEHRNLRGQMYWQLREDLRLDQVDIPAVGDLHRQAVMVQFEDDGKVVKVESKDEIKKRIGRSPDDLDAVVYWNWVRSRKAQKQRTDTIPAKEVDRALPLKVEDGHFVKPPKRPQTVAELAEWAESRVKQGRLPVREKERLPRRTYR